MQAQVNRISNKDCHHLFIIIEQLNGLTYKPIHKCGTNSIINMLSFILQEQNPELFEFDHELKLISNWDDLEPKPEDAERRRNRRSFIERNFMFPFNEMKRRSNLYKFSFVRNPYHRFVSAYLQWKSWMEKGNIYGKSTIKAKGFAILLNNDFSFKSFTNYVLNMEEHFVRLTNSHWRSQYYSLYPLCWENEVENNYNFIGRMENFEEDFNKILEAVNLPKTKLLHYQKRDDYDYRSYYTDNDIIDKIGKYYEKDIEEFNYSFE